MRTGELHRKENLRDGTVVILRSVRAQDLEALMSFANQLVGERARNPALGILMDRRVKRPDEEKFLKGLLAGIRKNDVASVAAEIEGRIVGNSEVQRMRSGDMRHVGRLGIAILEKYRGLGLGRMMMDTLLERAEELGMKLVTLEAFATNERALSFYQSLGFKASGRLPKGIRRGGDCIDLVYMFRQA